MELPTLELRRSCRLAGLTPSATAVSDIPDETAPRAATSSPLLYYRVPPTFGGTAGEDVDEWFVQYKRVNKSNGWDPAAALANVVFAALTNIALVWYENHKDKPQGCTHDVGHFFNELKACFGYSAAEKKRAEQNNRCSCLMRHAPRTLRRY